MRCEVFLYVWLRELLGLFNNMCTHIDVEHDTSALRWLQIIGPSQSLCEARSRLLGISSRSQALLPLLSPRTLGCLFIFPEVFEALQEFLGLELLRGGGQHFLWPGLLLRFVTPSLVVALIECSAGIVVLDLHLHLLNLAKQVALYALEMLLAVNCNMPLFPT